MRPLIAMLSVGILTMSGCNQNLTHQRADWVSFDLSQSASAEWDELAKVIQRARSEVSPAVSQAAADKLADCPVQISLMTFAIPGGADTKRGVLDISDVGPESVEVAFIGVTDGQVKVISNLLPERHLTFGALSDRPDAHWYMESVDSPPPEAYSQIKRIASMPAGVCWQPSYDSTFVFCLEYRSANDSKAIVAVNPTFRWLTKWNLGNDEYRALQAASNLIEEVIRSNVWAWDNSLREDAVE